MDRYLATSNELESHRAERDDRHGQAFDADVYRAEQREAGFAEFCRRYSGNAGGRKR